MSSYIEVKNVSKSFRVESTGRQWTQTTPFQPGWKISIYGIRIELSNFCV